MNRCPGRSSPCSPNFSGKPQSRCCSFPTISVVHQISDRVTVMCQGELIEIGDVEDVYADSQHPYTRALLSAIPPADPITAYEPIPIGEPRALSATDDGCRSEHRCWATEQVCIDRAPALVLRPSGIAAKCHISERSPEDWFEPPGSAPAPHLSASRPSADRP